MINIRKMNNSDKSEVLSMMKTFYTSDAVATNGSEQIFENDFQNCVNNSPYLEGYVFLKEEHIAGYAMLAKSYSTEYGKPVVWFEDLYLKSDFRGLKIIPNFIEYIEKLYPEAIFKLEVEDYNEHAVHVYKKLGFKELPYLEMQKS